MNVTNWSEPVPPAFHALRDQTTRAIGIIVNLVIVLIGTAGNTLLIWCFIHYSKLFVAANVFLQAHAGIGILFQLANGIVVIQDFTYSDVINRPEVWCLSELITNGLGMNLHVVSTLAVGVYRYFAVVKPYPVTSLKQWRVAIPFCVSIYVLILSILVICFLIREYRTPFFSLSGLHLCRSLFVDDYFRLRFLIIVASICFAILCLYAGLLRSLRKRLRVCVLPDNSRVRIGNVRLNATRYQTEIFQVSGDHKADDIFELTSHNFGSKYAQDQGGGNTVVAESQGQEVHGVIEVSAVNNELVSQKQMDVQTEVGPTLVHVKPAHLWDRADSVNNLERQNGKQTRKTKSTTSNNSGNGVETSLNGFTDKISCQSSTHNNLSSSPRRNTQINHTGTRSQSRKGLFATILKRRQYLHGPEKYYGGQELSQDISIFEPKASANPIEAIQCWSPEKGLSQSGGELKPEVGQQVRTNSFQNHFSNIGASQRSIIDSDHHSTVGADTNESNTAKYVTNPVHSTDQSDERAGKRTNENPQPRKPGKTLPQSIAQLALVKTMLFLLVSTLISLLPLQIAVSTTAKNSVPSDWVVVLCLTLQNCLFAFNWVVYGTQSSKVIRAYKSACAKVMAYLLAICRR